MNAPENPKAFRLVGTRPVRPDGVDKVTGKAIYGPDFAAAGMLHGAMVRSPHPHARIVSIDASKALALPGVKAVVTAADFPAQSSVEVQGGETSGDLKNMSLGCMAQDKVLYAGHAVCAVAATSPSIAEQAARLVQVNYEVLPHVIGIEEALAPDAPILHEGMITKGLEPAPEAPSNAAACFTLARGDAKAAMERAAVVASGRYYTPPVHQGYLEPHACVASWGADGQAQIWCSSQGHYEVRNFTAGILKMPIADLRVFPLEIGGGFGGKTTIYLEPVAMLLSKKAGRPVRMAMNRQEVFNASGPAPGSLMEVRLGADAEGRFVALELEFWSHAGAFPGSATHSSAMTALGAYNIADAWVRGWDVCSNMPSTHAYRAPGAPPIAFALEGAVDDVARQLGMDAIDIRLKNACREGDPGPMRIPHGRIGYVECLEAAKAHPHWSAPLGPNQGRGIAGAFWGNYGGPSTAAVALASDGSVMVTTGSPDIGGSRASMAIMAAETLGVAYDSVRVAIADTGSLGYSMLTGGSRVTFATGKAVVEATRKVIATLVERAASLMGTEPDKVEWRDGAAHGPDGQSLSIAAIAARSGQFSGPVSAEATVNALDYLPGFALHICDVEVDPESGQVGVVRYTAIQDVGTAIHPDYVEGQLQGGAVQGIGWALNEAYVFGPDGRMANDGFLDYRMPVCSDLPMIDTVLVEVPNPAHPYGVKGVGESPIVPPLGAVANALRDATGVRFTELPLTPDRVHARLHG
ncbi:xanthine dehydrogenase family protein molybdopterin-binding subunit [Novosphingobium sp. TH158]|uniref:xanthine dehydrogenase family protein molybdopterin-binding subunit n=1 Tax=Novosphingobium sp. TH158 TaxID=2067455 RepID=UPI000C7DEC83|nr:xanthine dehydrogenase family protein molybdopterin-binding subunit [Novosphingobium sp. TH158]PLK26453.1 oxidoreductase [Novosphingobium sp. TH158]